MFRRSFVVGILVAACSATTGPQSPGPPSGTSQATMPSTTSPSPGPVASFSDGRLLVGSQIAPGTYRTIRKRDAGGGFCYWERQSGSTGSQSDVIANSAGVGPRIVTIASTDVAFLSEDCGAWTQEMSPVPGPIGDGVWVVGVDLMAGAYVAPKGQTCVWNRLSGFGGTAGETIEAGTTNGVIIAASDKGFSSSSCGTWSLRR